MSDAGLPHLALSIRQPWAWAIFHAGKDFENRTRAALKHLPVLKPFRVAIHASRGMSQDYYLHARAFMASFDVDCPPPATLPRGGIVGTVELVGRRFQSDSRWSFGAGIELRHPEPCEFIPCIGRLGFFDWRASAPAEIDPPARWMMKEADKHLEPVDVQQSLFGGRE